MRTFRLIKMDWKALAQESVLCEWACAHIFRWNQTITWDYWVNTIPYDSSKKGGSTGIWTPTSGYLLIAETPKGFGSRCFGSALQLIINFSVFLSSFPCNWSPRYYQVILYSQIYSPLRDYCFAWRRARFLRRSFFLRHFQRWLPVFFQAREPRFMVNIPPTDFPYMSTSSEQDGFARWKWIGHSATNPHFRNKKIMKIVAL